MVITRVCRLDTWLPFVEKQIQNPAYRATMGASSMIKKLLKNYLWIIPFFLFFTAFFISFLFFSQEKRIVPSLLYLTSPEALGLLANQQLNCRLLKEQESNWTAGTVIAQSPQPGKFVKPFQTIFITLAKPVPSTPVPNAVGLSRTQVKSIFNSSYNVTWHSLYNPDIQHKCIAQISNGKEIILYESHNNTEYVIMPSFYKRNALECREFLSKYGIAPTIFHTGSFNTNHTCTHCLVIEQNPPAGTVISISSPPIIQLKI